jgi:hypothetical protein
LFANLEGEVWFHRSGTGKKPEIRNFIHNHDAAVL